jgi:hypothetical protein
MADRNATAVQKVAYLNTKIGPTLTAASIGFRDRSIISSAPENLDEILTSEHKLRLDALLEVWTTVSNSEGDDIARAWLIGANPWLRDESAVTALREDRFKQVTVAARAMVEDTPNF